MTRSKLLVLICHIFALSKESSAYKIYEKLSCILEKNLSRHCVLYGNNCLFKSRTWLQLQNWFPRSVRTCSMLKAQGPSRLVNSYTYCFLAFWLRFSVNSYTVLLTKPPVVLRVSPSCTSTSFNIAICLKISRDQIEFNRGEII